MNEIDLKEDRSIFWQRLKSRPKINIKRQGEVIASLFLWDNCSFKISTGDHLYFYKKRCFLPISCPGWWNGFRTTFSPSPSDQPFFFFPKRAKNVLLKGEETFKTRSLTSEKLIQWFKKCTFKNKGVPKSYFFWPAPFLCHTMQKNASFWKPVS